MFCLRAVICSAFELSELIHVFKYIYIYIFFNVALFLNHVKCSLVNKEVNLTKRFVVCIFCDL